MPFINHEQFIKAPIDLCFDLARNVSVHTQTTYKTNEKAVDGVTEGLLELGDTVTWEATHFGIRQKLTAKLIFMEKPNKFIDIMIKGAFHSFIHTHQFIEKNGGTILIDEFEYKSPFGLLGKLVDLLFLEKYMQRFIRTRAEQIKKIAEKNVDPNKR